MTSKKNESEPQNHTLVSTKVALFEGKQIRKVFHKNEWWFSIVDVIEVLTESTRPRKYWGDLKTKLLEEGYFQLSDFFGQLKIEASDGKKYLTDVANRDHMTDLELIFSMLGEASTKEITVKRDTQGFPENLQAAKEGGTIAGNARHALEQTTNKRVVTSCNYLPKKSKELSGN